MDIQACPRIPSLECQESVEAHCPRVHRGVVRVGTRSARPPDPTKRRPTPRTSAMGHGRASSTEVAVQRSDPARGGVGDVRGALGAGGGIDLVFIVHR
jgi:hypothetical protein